MINDKAKLRQLLKQPRWKILAFMLILNALLFWQAAIDWYFYINFNMLFARRAFAKRTAQRAHWVGSQIAKPHRLAFLALVGILIAGLAAAPNIQSLLYWSLGWGSAFSLFVISRSLFLIFSRTTSQLYRRPQN
jgi:hypothetical protein